MAIKGTEAVIRRTDNIMFKNEKKMDNKEKQLSPKYYTEN